MRISTFLYAFVLALLAGVNASAQTPFWSEDFAGGIPAGWTNQDLSGQNAIWTWCNNPGAPQNGSCPGVYTGQTAFASATSANGFATMDSDFYEQLPNNHKSTLTTTAINCSGKTNVFVSFQSQIGTFSHSAEASAVLRVSTNNTSWTTFTIFTGLNGASGTVWSVNPVYSNIDISSVAANQSTVYLQWYWDGNYDYFLNIDDVKVYDANPTPANDLLLSAFFYPASSFATPESQIDTDVFGFWGAVSNVGLDPQTGVQMKAWITDELDNILFQDSASIAILEPGVVDSIIDLSGSFTPDLPQGLYTIHYAVTADETEGTPGNNEDEDDFFVSASTFSKENNYTGGLRPGNGGDYYVGNVYTMSDNNLDVYKAVEADFSCSNDPNDIFLPDATVQLYLFRIADTVDANYANFDVSQFYSPSMDWLGYTDYNMPDTAQAYDLFRAPIEDANTGAVGVTLEKGARYMLVAGYVGANNLIFQSYNSESIIYYFVSSTVFGKNTSGGSNWFLAGFGDEDAAALRMIISLVSTTDDKPLAESAFKVFPNPASDRVVLATQFDQPTDADITIAQMDGKVIDILQHRGITAENIDYPVSKLASGMYIARIATKSGTKTLKFTVQK